MRGSLQPPRKPGRRIGRLRSQGWAKLRSIGARACAGAIRQGLAGSPPWDRVRHNRRASCRRRSVRRQPCRSSITAEEPRFARLSAGGEWIRKFSSAMPRHRHQRGRLHSTAEADDCSDDTATPTVDRPQLGRSLERTRRRVRNVLSCRGISRASFWSTAPSRHSTTPSCDGRWCCPSIAAPLSTS